MRKALMLASILTLPLLACAPFVAAPPTVTAQNVGCSHLVPEAWRKGVEPVDLPALGAAIGEWIAAFDGQTGRLDQANERTAAAIEITGRCEERDRQAVARATRRKVLGLF